MTETEAEQMDNFTQRLEIFGFQTQLFDAEITKLLLVKIADNELGLRVLLIIRPIGDGIRRSLSFDIELGLQIKQCKDYLNRQDIEQRQ